MYVYLKNIYIYTDTCIHAEAPYTCLSFPSAILVAIQRPRRVNQLCSPGQTCLSLPVFCARTWVPTLFFVSLFFLFRSSYDVSYSRIRLRRTTRKKEHVKNLLSEVSTFLLSIRRTNFPTEFLGF